MNQRAFLLLSAISLTPGCVLDIEILDGVADEYGDSEESDSDAESSTSGETGSSSTDAESSSTTEGEDSSTSEDDATETGTSTTDEESGSSTMDEESGTSSTDATDTDDSTDTGEPVMCPDVFPTFDKSCEADSDCALALHTINCCGTDVAWGIAAAELEAFDAAEAVCDSQYPACGCPTLPTLAEDGNTTEQGGVLAVSCQMGSCSSYVLMP